MNKNIRNIISRLKKGTMDIDDIPEEYSDDFEIINAERKLGLRKTYQCGYDVISNTFFVKEISTEYNSLFERKTFEEFSSFYGYLEGNIYENSCYYQLPTNRIPKQIDTSLLPERKAFIDYQEKDFSPYFDQTVLSEFDEIEHRKPLIKKWIEKFNSCSTSQQLQHMLQNYSRSILSKTVDVDFFLWKYVWDNEEHFDAIMGYVSSNYSVVTDSLCYIFNPDSVVQNFVCNIASKSSNRRYINNMKKIAQMVKQNELTYRHEGWFSSQTHYYCIYTSAFGANQDEIIFECCEYFENIEDFIKKLNRNLSNCDLSKAYTLNYDFSKCLVDETTKLPLSINVEYQYDINKYYYDNKFIVVQTWKDTNGSTIKEYRHEFDYFGDFVFFLNGDLSNSNLIYCDGLINLSSTQGIKFDGAMITSPISKALKIPYHKYSFKLSSDTSFDFSEKNEVKNSLTTQPSRKLLPISNNTHNYIEEMNAPNKKIHYISDLHLYHLLKNKNAESRADIYRVLSDLVDTLLSESVSEDIILINGDTCLDYKVFKAFISELKCIKRTIVFTIGNHDIWSCPNDNFSKLTKKFRNLLGDNKTYLLQNDILYFNDYNQPPERITEKEIEKFSEEKLREITRSARLILFGGTGFSGYNPLYNAEFGLYRHNKTIGFNRDFEIKECKKIEKLYLLLNPRLYVLYLLSLYHH